MNEEDDLLVRKSNLDNNVYIVGCEDGNPKNPELFATSFENLLAIAWHDKREMEILARHGRPTPVANELVGDCPRKVRQW